MANVEERGFEEDAKTFLKEKKVESRKYQEVIAEKCVGKNSLVVIPTGLGKTIIGILIASKILKTVPSESKIVIMAPTRPLIEQHFHSFIEKLSIPEDKCAILTGKTPPDKRAEIFVNNQVLFFTPHTLRNDLVNKKYDLRDTCLIIFDEAHHASGDYPYPLIADEYVQQNADGSILALTASPGASKKKIVELCNTLHIPLENIHIRSRKDADVKDYLKPMEIYKIGVIMKELMKQIYKAITNILEERLHYLSHLGFLNHQKKPLFEKVLRKDLIKLNLNLLGIIKGDGDKSGAYTAISVNAQALILHHMLELIEQQGLDILLEYLEKLNIDARKKSSSKAVKMLAVNSHLRGVFLELKKNLDFSPEELVHPKLPILKKILLEELNQNNGAKILVFVKLRNSITNIVNKLKIIPSIRPVRFVGQATKSKDDKGLSQKKQVEILELFKKGEYNVLVATNVAEEGLDVAECDLVIFYDVVASEIRLIQRKGRTARHRKGRVLILYTKNTRDEIHLTIALKKLKKMNVNLKKKAHLEEFYKHQQEQSNQKKSEKNLLVINEDNHKLQNNREKKLKKMEGYTLDYFAQNNINEGKSDFLVKLENDKITMSKDIPLKYGLRNELYNRNIPFNLVSSNFHIVIKNSILVQIYEMAHNEFSSSKYHLLYDKFKRDFDLVIFIFDVVEYKEHFVGEKRLLKKRIMEHSLDNQLQVVLIDHYFEIIFLIQSLLK